MSNSSFKLDKDAINQVKKELYKDASKEVEVENHLINLKEQKALSKSNVNQWKDCLKGFLIQNKKTNRIVEIRAPTVLLALKSVGWRARHTVLIEEINYSE